MPVRRLRLRGDWSDTGPDARPERESGRRSGIGISKSIIFCNFPRHEVLGPSYLFLEIAQARPVLHTSLMQRMTIVLSRMLNDPTTRAALCGGGEDSLEGVIGNQENTQSSNENTMEISEERQSELEGAEAAPAQSNQERGS